MNRTVVDLIHEDQRRQFGGNEGVLNEGGIESALARARNRFEYTGADLFECAASYVFGLAKNHGYQDANKRTAYMTGWTFLRINGFFVRGAPTDIIQLMLDVATDVADEAAIAAWLRERATSVE
ncbi:MAG: type II toxin-antitoxin system death-on-curing family toxin [Gemmatimonadaceae bacterium]